ncbi:MAG: hypothetical protein JO112_09290 [Planctomycetes bacterium]|nr:hypothetical protein [Planctomycetota bacterium]
MSSRHFVLGILIAAVLAGGGWSLAQQDRSPAPLPPSEGGPWVVTPAGDTAILLDQRGGKSWVLRRSSAGDFAWLPVKRLDSEAEVQRWKDREEALKGASSVPGRFQFRVPFETGTTHLQEGAGLEILDVWGTRPRIEIGGQYLVHGKYRLASHDQGTLYFHETADGWDNSGPDLDLQYTTVSKGQGEFSLLHGMAGPGFFHLTLVARDGDKYTTVANTYFGTGANVWRKKS